MTPGPSELEARLGALERKLGAVRELSRVLGVTHDLDRLLALLLDKITALLDAERATLFLLSETGDELWSNLTRGGAVEQIRLKVGEGIAGWVAASGETVNLPDAYADPRFQKHVDQRTGFRTHSVLCMPMPDSQGRVIGVVQLLNKRGRPFDGDDEAILGVAAAHAGIAIENTQLYRSVVAKNAALVSAEAELRRKVAEQDLLVEIEREVAASTDIDDLLHRLLTRAMQLVESEAGAVLLRDQPSGDLFFRSAIGGSGEALTRTRLAEGRGIAGWVAQHRRPLIVDDPAADPRHDTALARELGYLPPNILAVPLVQSGSGGEDEEAGEPPSLGAIELLGRVGRPGFDENDLKLCTLIAGHAARAVLLTRAREERQKQGRLAAIGQLLSGVLHDLKTPMTIISGYAQLMVNVDSLDDRARYCESILKQFDLMSAMTREVLEFARGESIVLVRKVYVKSYFDGVRQQLERELLGKKIELAVETRYAGVAWFDELKLHRLVNNISRNAVQAMPGGGRYRIVVDASDRELLIDFHDTGPGVPPELEGRMFQLFATAGKKDGTGLGLAIVKKIVDEHRGRVSYTSRPGEGTTFHVAIPLQRDSQ